MTKGSRPKQRTKRSKTVATVAQPSTPATPAPPPGDKKTVTVDLEESMKGALRAIGGSKADDWNDVIANQAVNTIWKSGNEATDSQRTNGVLSALICMKPGDEFEGMLTAQMIAVQNAAMECYKRAMAPGQSFQWHQESLNQANKLSRTFATLLEALNRHRGKGQQKVTVEHVHVYSGGQAVVGNVEAPGAGGIKIQENQPHAIRYAECNQVRGEDKEREGAALSVAGNA